MKHKPESDLRVNYFNQTRTEEMTSVFLNDTTAQSWREAKMKMKSSGIQHLFLRENSSFIIWEADFEKANNLINT